MKKKILVVGLIGLLFAGGLVLAGCNTACPRYSSDCSVSIDSTGHIYDGYAYCDNNDCAVSDARNNNTYGKHTCDCH
ncbi:hypothetical protein R84B8_01595 [Treponema sp. R8-4-B8]